MLALSTCVSSVASESVFASAAAATFAAAAVAVEMAGMEQSWTETGNMYSPL
jgi:hypothetical protein